MANLRLTMACDAGQLQALYDGSVELDGIDLEIERVVPRDRHHRMTHEAPWQICEYSTAGLMSGLGKLRFSAIPVFPLREFRHRGIWVAASSRITKPSELNGRRIGVQNWDNSAAIWQKGPLALDHGLDIVSIEWVAQLPVENDGFVPPDWLKLTILPKGTTPQRALLEGEVDAVMLPAPQPFGGEDAGKVRRLFPDFVQVEQEFFTRHGVFPIMHTVVVRHDVLEANPWVAKSAFEGIRRALEVYVERQRSAGAPSAVWPGLDWAEQERRLGPNPWPSGVASNRAALEMAVDFAVTQGLAARRF